MNFQTRKAIKGNYIIFEQRLINGYIFIKGTKIQKIVEDIDENQELIAKKISKYPLFRNFTESIIMASAVDLSVALSAAYDTQWNLTEEFTELALQGGTCLIVNKPYCYYGKEQDQTIENYQIEMYRAQVQHLEENSCVDFIQSSYVDEQSFQNVDNLFNEGCFIFNMFLHKTFLPEIEPMSNPKNCEKILKKLHNNNSILVTHLQYNTDKDFIVSSPFRKTDLLDNIPIAPDGIKGDLSSADSESSSQNEPNSPINLLSNNNKKINIQNKVKQQINKEERSDEFSPIESEKKFCKYSKSVAKKKQYQLIARTELMSYCNEKTLSEQQSSGSSYKDSSFIFPPSPQSQVQQSRFQSPQTKKSIIDLKSRTRSYSGLLQRRKTSLQQKAQESFTSFKLSIIDTNNNNNNSISENESPRSIKEIQSEKKIQQINIFKNDYLYFLAFKPDLWERDAVKFMYNALLYQKKQGESGINILMTGFSSALTIGKLIQLRNKFGSTNQISIQLAYPFLFYDCESVPIGGTIFKDDIPFRSKENKLLLQRAIQTNWIQSIGSNHLYVDPTLKFINEGDFRRAFSGLTCIGLQLQITWTALWSCANRHANIDLNSCRQSLYSSEESNFRKRIITKLMKLQRLIATEPADFIKQTQYGRLEKESLANLLVWDPFSFENRNLSISERFDPKLHILNNQILLGRIESIFFKGDLAYERKGNQLIKMKKCKGQNIKRAL